MSAKIESLPRYVPDAPWPLYAFVPGRGLPHPISDPDGHSFGSTPAVEAFDPARWPESRAYLRGVDLFNYGYYWEAHEVWEGIWRGYDRSQTPALFLQGLIKLAAAGVKTREGVVQGVTRLAADAAAHFREIHNRPDGGNEYCGLRADALESLARGVEREACVLRNERDRGPRVVFSFALRPGESAT
jgi:predicted metal-dependent hydrolase